MSTKVVNTFPADDPDHIGRVAAFQDAVRRDAGTPAGRLSIVRQHITTGSPVGLDADAYYDLRSQVAALYDLHPSAVVVVGSCRTGFSISQKEHKPRYRPFGLDSDIDVAVVSGTFFDELWDAVFAGQSSHDWVLSAIRSKQGPRKKQPHHLARDLFNGCIDPESLNAIKPVPKAVEWVENFDKISRSRVYGRLTIKGRLYRSWSRLESYQDIMVTQCNAELAGHR